MSSETEFPKAIRKSLESCAVLIAVIGKYWLTATDKEGKRRLDHSEDYVRLEIATALSRGVRVIPLLVEGVPMPPPSELPDDLRTLPQRMALKIRYDRYRYDSKRLIDAVEEALGVTAKRKKPWRPPVEIGEGRLVIAIGSGVTIMLVALSFLCGALAGR
jgi:hypothetical protein